MSRFTRFAALTGVRQSAFLALILSLCSVGCTLLNSSKKDDGAQKKPGLRLVNDCAYCSCQECQSDSTCQSEWQASSGATWCNAWEQACSSVRCGMGELAVVTPTFSFSFNIVRTETECQVLNPNIWAAGSTAANPTLLNPTLDAATIGATYTSAVLTAFVNDCLWCIQHGGIYNDHPQYNACVFPNGDRPTPAVDRTALTSQQFLTQADQSTGTTGSHRCDEAGYETTAQACRDCLLNQEVAFYSRGSSAATSYCWTPYRQFRGSANSEVATATPSYYSPVVGGEGSEDLNYFMLSQENCARINNFPEQNYRDLCNACFNSGGKFRYHPNPNTLGCYYPGGLSGNAAFTGNAVFILGVAGADALTCTSDTVPQGSQASCTTCLSTSLGIFHPGTASCFTRADIPASASTAPLEAVADAPVLGVQVSEDFVLVPQGEQGSLSWNYFLIDTQECQARLNSYGRYLCDACFRTGGVFQNHPSNPRCFYPSGTPTGTATTRDSSLLGFVFGGSQSAGRYTCDVYATDAPTMHTQCLECLGAGSASQDVMGIFQVTQTGATACWVPAAIPNLLTACGVLSPSRCETTQLTGYSTSCIDTQSQTQYCCAETHLQEGNACVLPPAPVETTTASACGEGLYCSYDAISGANNRCRNIANLEWNCCPLGSVIQGTSCVVASTIPQCTAGRFCNSSSLTGSSVCRDANHPSGWNCCPAGSVNEGSSCRALSSCSTTQCSLSEITGGNRCSASGTVKFCCPTGKTLQGTSCVTPTSSNEITAPVSSSTLVCNGTTNKKMLGAPCVSNGCDGNGPLDCFECQDGRFVCMIEINNQQRYGINGLYFRNAICAKWPSGSSGPTLGNILSVVNDYKTKDDRVINVCDPDNTLAAGKSYDETP